ncbi:MAG: Asp-tRNA(Asn)/Glu-tRNA(Gln) amidotransferase subunit GatC [Patescibacteria group bacterium]|nr:Asp-tRNA(Asn)/Glu-tRNA(Gln) amidotransferase subunit GatC [Patescibacteria group bacterium]
MSKLDISQIEHIAKLSRLKLTDEEKKLYSEQLSSVLDYVEQLSLVDTKDVEPTANITGLKNVLREDEVEESGISHEDIKLNAQKKAVLNLKTVILSCQESLSK